jgi:hypothetical protein
MKRKNKKTIQIIRQILSTLSGDVRRKVIVEAAEAKGLIVNDTWPVVKPCAKGAERGHYSVKKMIALADAILNNGKQVAKSDDTQSISEPVDESGMFEAAAAIHEEKSYNNLSWGEVPYTEDDVNDELSLMGTYL